MLDPFCLSWSQDATCQTAEVDLLLLILSTSLDGLHGFSDLRYQEIFPVGETLSPKHHGPLNPLCSGSLHHNKLIQEDKSLRDRSLWDTVLAFCSAQPLNKAISQGPVPQLTSLFTPTCSP